MEDFTVNGVNLSTYGAYWDGSQLWDKPRKDVIFYQIPGRSGDLSFFTGRYENVNINVNCYIKENFVENFNNLMNFLYSLDGYVRIENTIDTEAYRMGQFVEEITPQPTQMHEGGYFTLVFNCMPQRFLFSGEEQITGFDFQGNLTFTNPTNSSPFPFIHVVNGTGQEFTEITINGEGIFTNADVGTIEYDGESGYLTVTALGETTKTYVGQHRLKPGTNVIKVTNASGYVIPHWWEL